MASALQTRSTVQPSNRRVLPSLRRAGRDAAQVRVRKTHLTLGDLIAAAFDTVGAEVRDVAQLLSSNGMTRSLGRRVVLMP